MDPWIERQYPGVSNSIWEAGDPVELLVLLPTILTSEPTGTLLSDPLFLPYCSRCSAGMVGCSTWEQIVWLFFFTLYSPLFSFIFFTASGK
jgi:hypothetical protein